MSSHVLYEHNDDGDYLLTIQECRQQEDDPAYAGRIEVSIDGRTCCIPASQRRAAATALIGHDYTIISDADYIALAGERDQLKAAQPDTWAVDQATCVKCAWHRQNRPEPVDPASLNVGDLVDYELLPAYKPCRIVGEVEGFHFGGAAIQLHGHWWNTEPSMATVRVLHPAEPEVDPDEVNALYEEIYLTDEGQRQVRDNQDGRADEYRAIAEGLVRSGRVRMVRDA